MLRNLFLLLISMLLIGCAENDKNVTGGEDREEITKLISEKQEGDFILRLMSKKSHYLPHEPVEIYAMLKYVGPQSKIQINHASSPFWFEIKEHNNNIIIHNVQETASEITVLEKDVWHEMNFVKSGVITDDDFVQDYFNKEGFPKGDYTIKLTADFNTIVNIEKENYKFSTSINIKIQ